MLFCLYFKFHPLPASVECVCLFAQFLSRTFKAVSSIQNYISGIRTLHALLELPFAAASSIDLKLTLKGLNPKQHCDGNLHNSISGPFRPGILLFVAHLKLYAFFSVKLI